MKNLPVFLMGCGGVGRQLLQHIVSCRSLHAKQVMKSAVLFTNLWKSLSDWIGLVFIFVGFLWVMLKTYRGCICELWVCVIANIWWL